MSVLSAEKVRRLSLGVSVLNDLFPGFEAGDFVVLYGDRVSFWCFVLCVRCELSLDKGGLGSSAVFVDGENSFSHYLVADVARSYGLGSRKALERIYVSRGLSLLISCLLWLLRSLSRFMATRTILAEAMFMSILVSQQKELMEIRESFERLEKQLRET